MIDMSVCICSYIMYECTKKCICMFVATYLVHYCSATLAAAAVPAVDYLFSTAEVCLIYHRAFCLPEICSFTTKTGRRTHMDHEYF